MKKRTIIISLICILSVTIIMIVFAVISGRKPYKNLDTSQIVSAVVRLTPPDETIQITEMTELVNLLKDVVIYNEDNSYKEYSGQGVIFTLTMTDGRQTSIMAYNPFLVIDGVGYKTKYKPCEELNHYANMLLEQTKTLSFADNVQATTFQATVIEVTDSFFLAKPVDDSPELDSSDQFSVPNTEKLALQTGDTVEIAYNGEILESYPAQLGEVSKITLLEQAKADVMWDRIPMVRINGKLYYDTGRESTVSGRCGNMDGEITSTVDGTGIPMENNQSNFGSGFGYQYGADDTIEIYMNEKWFIFEYREEKEASVVKTYDVTDSDTAFENDELVTMVKYYEMSDGTWKTDTHTYRYRLEITGRMGGAEKDSTFVFLSNIENITFEQAWKAAGFSSLMSDYFDEEDARLVALK